jgi:hypothetical protein
MSSLLASEDMENVPNFIQGMQEVSTEEVSQRSIHTFLQNFILFIKNYCCYLSNKFIIIV